MRSSALLLVAALVAGAPATAHELGALQVRARFTADGSYALNVAVDATHLPPTLARQSNDELARELVAGSRVLLDGVAVAPHLSARGVAPSPGPLTFVLEGRASPSTQQFAFALDVPVGAYYLSCTAANGDDAAQWVEPRALSRPFALVGSGAAPRAPESALAAFARYVVLGVTHIVPLGADHILFVAGLFLLTLRVRPLLVQVTAFTIAHTITLALTVSGVTLLSSRVVEPLIALSITCVAVENIFVRELTWRRTGLVFCFGLLHGMGFAGALSEIGLPAGRLALGVLGFNVGVEIGQLIVLCTAALLLGWSASYRWHRARVVVPASLAIAVIGLAWTVERVF